MTRQGTAFFLVLAAPVTGVLFFGAVHTWVYTLVFLMIFVAALLRLPDAVVATDRGKRALRLPQTHMGFLFAVMALFLVCQMIPLPEVLLGALSPESVLSARHGRDPLQDPAVSGSLWAAIAPYRFPVCQSLVRWTAYGLFFFTLVSLLDSRRRIRTAAWVLVITAAAVSLYGMIETFSGHGQIWWYAKRSYRGHVTGTFINRNHFAGFMEMGVMLAVGLGLAAGSTSGRRMPGGKQRFWRHRLIAFDKQWARQTFVVFLGVVMALGTIFSGSRGGMIATGAGLLVFGLLLTARPRQRKKGAVILGFVLLIFVYAVPMGIEKPLQRFDYFDDSFEIRTRFALRTLDLFQDYVLAGVGAGNFQYAYPRWQSALDAEGGIVYAHNDWAQLLAEMGLVGVLLFVIGAGWFFLNLARAWRRRRNSFSVSLAAAGFAAAGAMAVHAYSDFNLHLPANALVLAALLAIAHAAACQTHHARESTETLSYGTFPLRGTGGVLTAFIVGGILVFGMTVVRHGRAEYYCPTVRNSTLNRNANPPMADIRRAARLDPSNAAYWFTAAKRGVQIRDAYVAGVRQAGLALSAADVADRRRRTQQQICRDLAAAARTNPLYCLHHLWLGWAYRDLSVDADRPAAVLAAADAAMDRAAYHAGDHRSDIHLTMGRYWTWRAWQTGLKGMQRAAAWNRACWHFQKAVSLIPTARVAKAMAEKIRSFLTGYNATPAQIEAAVGNH